MVGGTVIETVPYVRAGESRVWLNVRGTGHDHHRTLGISVVESPAARSIGEGDTVWWQGPWVMWTPRVGGFSDYKLRRIGCSGVNRPEESATVAVACAWRWV